MPKTELTTAEGIRSRLGDELSTVLFDGWLRYLSGEDESCLGKMLQSYARAATKQVRRDSPVLFALLEEQLTAYARQNVLFAAASPAALRQMRFCRGMGADISLVCCADASLLSLRREGDPPFCLFAPKALPPLPVVLPPGPQAGALRAALAESGTSPSRLLGEEDFPLSPFTDLDGCYFDTGLVSFGEDACFVDGGALDLYSSHRFARMTKGRYRAIYAFEPDPLNFRECRQNSGLFDHRLHLSPAALWDGKARLAFDCSGVDARCDPQGRFTVEGDSLDSLLSDAAPTHIKLHLEGAEESALLGAREVIRRYRPQLMIALGHRREDILCLPRRILEAEDSYRLYLRHYSNSMTETVLYAI